MTVTAAGFISCLYSGIRSCHAFHSGLWQQSVNESGWTERLTAYAASLIAVREGVANGTSQERSVRYSSGAASSVCRTDCKRSVDCSSGRIVLHPPGLERRPEGDISLPSRPCETSYGYLNPSACLHGRAHEMEAPVRSMCRPALRSRRHSYNCCSGKPANIPGSLRRRNSSPQAL